MHNTVTVYSVFVMFDYDGMENIHTFLNLEDARTHFQSVVKEQKDMFRDCTVHLVGPIQLPGDPVHGTTVMQKRLDPSKTRKLRDNISALQQQLRDMEEDE